MENIENKFFKLKYILESSNDSFIICVVDDENVKMQIIDTISSKGKTFVDTIGFKECETEEEEKEMRNRTTNMNNSETKNIIFDFLENFNSNYFFIVNSLNIRRDIYQNMNKNIILLMSSKLYIYFLRNAKDFSSFCFKIEFSNIDNIYFNSDVFENEYNKDKEEYIRFVKKLT